MDIGRFYKMSEISLWYIIVLFSRPATQQILTGELQGFVQSTDIYIWWEFDSISAHKTRLIWRLKTYF